MRKNCRNYLTGTVPSIILVAEEKQKGGSAYEVPVLRTGQHPRGGLKTCG